MAIMAFHMWPLMAHVAFLWMKLELVRNELDAVNSQLQLTRTSWKTQKIANCAMKM